MNRGDDEEPLEKESDAADTDAKGATDRYVPPSLRRSGAGARTGKDSIFDQEQNAIRVSNLSKRVCEQDIYDLFEPFGKIVRVSLPRNSETNEPKGFAFVTYLDRQSAVEAMHRLQNHGYDHLILNLEWAKPSKDGEGGGGFGGGLSSTFRSGYGKQLAQDTKERVVFTSHGNR